MAIKVGNDIGTSVIESIPLGVYYYAIPHNKTYESNYLGFVNTIEGLTYNPFLELSDIFNVIECNFDTDKYGKPNGSIPKCYRIFSLESIEKDLGNVQLFSYDGQVTNKIDEPRLQAYPFRYFLITDYMNSPLLIRPELVDSNDNRLRVKVKTCAISQQTKYNIYVENYKGDSEGNLNGMVNSCPMMLPVTSSAYAQFLATSSATFSQGNINAMLENDLSLKQGLASNNLKYQQGTASNLISGISSGFGALGSLLGGNIGGAISGAIGVGGAMVNQHFNTLTNQLANSQLNERNKLTDFEISTMANAKITDMINTPNSIKTSGNDSIFNLINSNRKVDIIEYGLDDRTESRLIDYFAKYGYRYNKWDFIELNSRKYFNFIKTDVCNIHGENIPNEYLEEIKNIFNRGVTIWHVDNGATPSRYTFEQLYNNKEVN